MEQLSADLANYFGYHRELIELFLKLFSPAEALEFFDANEQVGRYCFWLPLTTLCVHSQDQW